MPAMVLLQEDYFRRLNDLARMSVDPRPIYVRRGFNQSGNPVALSPGTNNIFRLEIRELERVEVHLSEEGLKRSQGPLVRREEGRLKEEASSNIWVGYMVVGEELRPLLLVRPLIHNGVHFTGSQALAFWENMILSS